jgi:hypothetical protein
MSEILFQDHILAPLRSGREEAKKEEKKLSKNQERIFFRHTKKTRCLKSRSGHLSSSKPERKLYYSFLKIAFCDSVVVT